MDSLGKKCPVCDEYFHAYDDVVVCPECGTPYHRVCYDKVGKCIYKDTHGMEQASQTNTNSENKTKTEESSANKCARCGKENRESALFCDNCGFPLGASPMNGAPFVQEQTNPFDPMAGINPDEEFEQGVTAGDLARYVKVATPYYINVFNRIKKKGGIGKFNFAALIFSGGWMLFRKQYAKGIIVTIIVGLLMIGSTFFSYTYSGDVLQNVLDASGLGASSTATDIYNNMDKLVSAFYDLSIYDKLLYMLPSILNFIRYAICLVLGILGNRIYYKHCVNKVKSIKKSDDGQNTSASEKLQTEGGVNTKIAFCLLICLMIIEYLPYYILI